jgi:hypothetical protein
MKRPIIPSLSFKRSLMTGDRWETLAAWSSYGASIFGGWAGLALAYEYSIRKAWSLPLSIAAVLAGGIGGMLAGMLGSVWITIQLGSLRKRKREDDSQASDI